MIERKQTREVKVGNVFIGGSNQVVIQSMTNTDTRDVIKTVEQIKKLEEAGCEIVRVAVPDMEAAEALREIKNKINIPLVADIHFDYRLALKALENGIDKLRINPGNIGSKEKIKMVVDKAKERKVPIRIGVNSGSIEKDILAKYGKPTPECLVESALRHVQILENYDFTDIIISVKASNVQMCIESYKLMSSKVDYPLHVGVTEAGTVWSGMVKSSVGIGSILSQGIGDTIRVSITCDPVEEIYCAKQILKSLGLRKFGIEIVSCPTCGRTEIDLITLANEVEKACQNINKDLKVAVMGCVVNGPGEAKEADIGVAGGKGVGILFKKGKIYKKVSEDEILAELIKGIREM